ncbi:MAG: nucleoid occlusion factor SlmA [Pseudomonadales bacterium]
MSEDSPSRKDQILQALATMLEESPGARITTSGLARQVGVSEAALYRHFPSKAKMFETLIEFIEETIFSRISLILSEESKADQRCAQTLGLLLTFTERNPGITRILTGDPLAGETDRLRVRVGQFFERLETQLRQILREAELRDGSGPTMSVNATANLLLVVAEGRISQFVRSDFSRLPTEGWEEQWETLRRAIF